MTPTIQDILVLLCVAVAAVYMVLRLRRVGTGQSKCACGTKACGAAAAPCGGVKGPVATGGLPVVSPPCNQGGCGCEKI